MKLCDLLAGVPVTGGAFDPQMEVDTISYDSRTIRPGALYVALRGEKTDGHRHIERALSCGAVAAVCSEVGAGQRIYTADTRLALALISANWFGHPGDDMCLIGVTGTNGKTTTTHLIKAILEGVLHTTVGLVGTNHILIGEKSLPAQRTTPESYELQRLLRMMADEGCTHVVMEVSSHGLIQQRTAGLTFNVGIFTNLTQDHLDYHLSMEDYRDAKGLLFKQCRSAVLNLDDEAGRWYRERVDCPVITYSENRDSATLTAKYIRLFHSHVEFEGVTREEICRVYLPIPGGFTIYNALAALGGCLALGLPLKGCVPPLRSVSGVKGRVEVVSVPRPYTVIIDYAHTPNALENILVTAREFTAGRLICLFGCGGDRDPHKRPIMGAIGADLADFVVLTSDNPRSEPPGEIIEDILLGMEDFDTPYHIEPDRIQAIRWVLTQGQLGDVIVLAGKGHEDYQELEGGKIHLDEREIIADFFATKPRRGEISMEKVGQL